MNWSSRDYDGSDGPMCQNSESKPQLLLRLLYGIVLAKMMAEESYFILRLCSPEHHDNDTKVLPLPISDYSLNSIMATWQLPTEFLRMLRRTMPLVTTFSANKDIHRRPLERNILVESMFLCVYKYQASCFAVADPETGTTVSRSCTMQPLLLPMLLFTS